MFKNLFRKQITVNRDQDRIWLSERYKLAGIMTHINTLTPQTTRIVLVAHFPSTFRHLESLLQSGSRTYEPYPTPLEAVRLATITEYESPSRILLVLASALPSPVIKQTHQTLYSNFEVVFIVAEHHPLPSQDDKVLLFAQDLPFSSTITYYEALDGALLKRYGGNQVSQLMVTLKIPENLPLTNSLVDKTIRTAQEKLSQRITQNMSADSAEQWFQQNSE